MHGSTSKSSTFSAQQMLYLVIAVLVVAVYAGYYLSQLGNQPSAHYEPLPSSGTPLENHIAILDSAQRIWIVDPTTRDRYLLSDESLHCNYPTWSPDGVYIGYIATDSGGRTSIYASSANGDECVPLVHIDGYKPTYLDWSPNSRALIFRFNNGTSFWCQVVSLDAVENAFSFEYRRNLFWQWSYSGEYILWNRDEHITVTDASSSNTRVDPEQNRSRFRAPVWSSRDRKFLFMSKYRGHTSLVEFVGDSESPKPVYPTNAQSSIVISPDYTQMAALDYRRGSSGILSIVGLHQGKEEKGHLLTRARAVFWSPDSRYLAIWTRAVPPSSNNSNASADRHTLTEATDQSLDAHRWWIFDTKENAMLPLVSFIPTKACVDMAWHFSQYHASHTFWSPDSKHFLVSSIDPETNESHIWKVDVLGHEMPVDLGEGTFATWSWQ